MSLVIDTFQSISGQVSVNLRGDQVSMPEKLLDTPQVGSRIEHVSGEAVSQFVRRKVWIQSSREKVKFQPALDQPWVEWLSVGEF